MPTDFATRQKALADRMGEMLAQMDGEHPGLVQKLDSKLKK